MSLPTPERRSAKIAARAVKQTEFSAKHTHCLAIRQLAWRSAPPADRAKARHDWLQAFPVARPASASRYRWKCEAEHLHPPPKRRTAQDTLLVRHQFLHAQPAAPRRIHRANDGMRTTRSHHPHPAWLPAWTPGVHRVATALRPPTHALATLDAKAQAEMDSPAPPHSPESRPAEQASRRGWHRPPRVDAARQAMPATPAVDNPPAWSPLVLAAKALNQAHAHASHAPAARRARYSIPIHRHPRRG